MKLVVEGAFEHKDSMGTGSVIRPGDVFGSSPLRTVPTVRCRFTRT